MRDAKNVSTKIPDKYLDFHDVFDKAGTDILLEHNEHNMSIEFKDGKMQSYL